MLIDWTRLLPALLCLLPPIAWFHGRRVRYRALSHDWSGYWMRTFGLGLHSIDFGRAVLGAWCLAAGIAALPDATGPWRHGALVVQGAILAAAVALQTFVSKQPGTTHAPFAFMAGLVVGFLPLHIAGLALCLAVAIAAGLRTPAGFFPVFAFSIMVIGLALSGMAGLIRLALIASITVLPWLLTLLFPRTLVLSHLTRRISAAEAAEPDPR